MKTASQIYRQHSRISARIYLIARMSAKKAHPATGGNSMLCHNWGNAAAKAAWARAYQREDRAMAIYQRMYSASEHAHNHSENFRPIWCEHCQGNK